jgi:hypothetical protein
MPDYYHRWIGVIFLVYVRLDPCVRYLLCIFYVCYYIDWVLYCDVSFILFPYSGIIVSSLTGSIPGYSMGSVLHYLPTTGLDRLQLGCLAVSAVGVVEGLPGR